MIIILHKAVNSWESNNLLERRRRSCECYLKTIWDIFIKHICLLTARHWESSHSTLFKEDSAKLWDTRWKAIEHYPHSDKNDQVTWKLLQRYLKMIQIDRLIKLIYQLVDNDKIICIKLVHNRNESCLLSYSFVINQSA